MKKGRFSAKLKAYPYKRAKCLLQLAKTLIAALFIATMTGTAITGWFLFTSSPKLLFAAILTLLGVLAFFGGRAHREVYEAAQERKDISGHI